MTYKECLEWMAKEKAFLDTIDLEEFFVENKEIHNIMQSIEDKYGKDYKEEPFIFNCMSSDEFIDYIKERYKGMYTFDESINYYIRKL